MATDRTENKKSTPVETPKDKRRNHVNQSTEEKQKSSYGLIGIIVIIAIIVLGILWVAGGF